MAALNDRFYGTRAFAVLVLILFATVLLLYTWSETEAGEVDPPPAPKHLGKAIRV
jgi:hypothetical protein